MITLSGEVSVHFKFCKHNNYFKKTLKTQDEAASLHDLAADCSAWIFMVHAGSVLPAGSSDGLDCLSFGFNKWLTMRPTLFLVVFATDISLFSAYSIS